MSDLFYGLPQEIWDDLCVKTEEILYEQKIGNHIVGLYPAGKRLEGIESESPIIICLYIDSVEDLLNPLKPRPSVKEFSLDLSLSKVIFFELGQWIECACTPICPLDPKANNQTKHNIISEVSLAPCAGEFLYEDETITPVVDLVSLYTKTKAPGLLNDIGQEIVRIYKMLL